MTDSVDDERPGASGRRDKFGGQPSQTISVGWKGDAETYAGVDCLLSRIQSPTLAAVARQWNEARGKKSMPNWADLSDLGLSSAARQMWGFDYDPRTKDFVGRMAGSRLRRWIGEDFVGRRLADLHPQDVFQECRLILANVVTPPLLARTSGRLFTVDDITVTGERIMLPMADDGRTASGVLGASDYRPPALLGPVKLIHENVEWYPI